MTARKTVAAQEGQARSTGSQSLSFRIFSLGQGEPPSTPFFSIARSLFFRVHSVGDCRCCAFVGRLHQGKAQLNAPVPVLSPR